MQSQFSERTLFDVSPQKIIVRNISGFSKPLIIKIKNALDLTLEPYVPTPPQLRKLVK